jgi:tRNA A37 methylthiotransferase MiaB
LTVAPDLEEAEIAIINTCGFIEPAIEESVGMILEIAAMKRAGKLKRLYVTGCLVQRFGYKLKRELPEVDGWLGTGEIHRIAHLWAKKRGGGPFSNQQAHLSGGSPNAQDSVLPLLHRLCQNRGRLFPSMHLLHDPGHSRPS